MPDLPNNDLASGMQDQAGEIIAKEGYRVLKSLSNRDFILSKIKNKKFHKDTWNCSIFFTIYFKFSESYSWEEINKQIINSLNEYKIDEQKDCTYKIGDICCNILPEYSFVSDLNSFNFMDDDSFETYPPQDNSKTLIPYVTSVTVYVASVDDKKIPISTFMRISSKMENTMKEERIHLRKSGTFTYFQFDDISKLEKMYTYLNNEIKKLDFNVYLDRIGQDELRLQNTFETQKLIATLL